MNDYAETDRQETETVLAHHIFVYSEKARRQTASPQICRMHNNRRIKELMFGRMEGANRRGRPHKEWLDDITEWGKASLQELSQAAKDWTERAGRVW